MSEKAVWSADPLVWGHGPKSFEVFLEPTCPYSAKAFPKMFELLELAGESKINVKARIHSQPWHMFSGVVSRAILAASTTEGGKGAAKRVFEAVFKHREEFEFAHHAGGPNMDQTPNGILRRIEQLSGVAIAKAFAIPDLDREVKWQTRYARQNGIHVSPTFMIDGIVRSELGSGDAVETWLQALQLDQSPRG